MKVTYIGHSGFLVETGIANLLFDYYKGTIPKITNDLPVIVFVSHKHSDHYNPEVFRLAKQYANIHYFISNDIQLSEKIMEDYELTPEFMKDKVAKLTTKSKTVSAEGIRLNYEIRLKSDETDFVNAVSAISGVKSAVLVSYNGDYMG